MTTTKKEAPSKRSGLKSTEFWLSAVTAVIGLLIAGNIIDPEGSSSASRIVGFACSALAALGYTVSRTLVKKADAENS
jgi:drug/metabolite transporter (DMT)-like permease